MVITEAATKNRPDKYRDGFVPLYNPRRLIDSSVDSFTFTQLLRADVPFTFFKAGEGEFRTALGYRRIAISHDILPGMQEHMTEAIVGMAKASANNNFGGNAWLALHCPWYQHEIQPWVVEHGIGPDDEPGVQWANQSLWQAGLQTFGTLAWMAAVRRHPCTKVMVANEALGPVANALKCEHVKVPPRDCYEEYARILGECRGRLGRGKVLFVFCAGPVSELLIWDLYQKDKKNWYVDCGSVFDQMVVEEATDSEDEEVARNEAADMGLNLRTYMKNKWVRELIRTYYSPFVREVEVT